MQDIRSQFAAWARRKPAAEAYDYTDSRTCAFAQFGRFIGEPKFIGCGSARLRELDVEKALVGAPRTFGALADRLSAPGEAV